MKPTLVVLAAGMGSRYGGLKQVDPVGPSGEAILDYSVFDAVRGGFGKVVFVIRHDFEDEFKDKVGRKYEGLVPVEYAYQDIADLPAPYTVPSGRTKCAEKERGDHRSELARIRGILSLFRIACRNKPIQDWFSRELGERNPLLPFGR